MICPECSYVMSAFDVECPRCHGEGIKPRQQNPATQALDVHASPQQPAALPTATASQAPQTAVIPAPQYAPAPPSAPPPQAVYPMQGGGEHPQPYGYPPHPQQPVLVQTNVRGGGFLSGLGQGAGVGIGCCCLAPVLLFMFIVFLTVLGQSTSTQNTASPVPTTSP